ncbi:MAG TPA: hypothetical protein PLF50_06075 [Candidatus Cloacimonadota bacterium]|nr:hypothetical protein [Candidatus Cloacimonadota bacterium]
MIKKTLFTERSSSAQWKQTRKKGILLQNKKMGIDIYHYTIKDEKDKVMYDTIGISEPTGGCIIVLVNQNGDLGLINQYRPIPDKIFISCIRGFNEDHLIPDAIVKKELMEEANIRSITLIKQLGIVYPNTTYFINPISVYLVCVETLDTLTDLKSHVSARVEGISSITYYTKESVWNMIAQNEIQCQMTLSALMLYFSTSTYQM